ncbi:hypothetical protein QDR37_10090 [Amnibacterium sp. CER49]|uniref:hypothetical protein n=1 Tax=Amnibacterium sp. CER49 TaxID=3039161 RepID=UPI00244BCEA8|nr:hypothetical protein [Amnibacterium sp. CER49]MDH2444290.1 hypothetical protein [Amnibacterium sp. CER49]
MSPLRRRIRAVALVTALTGATVVTPLLAAPAFAAGGGNAGVQVCRQIQANFSGVNIYGNCVGYIQSNGSSAGLASILCKVLGGPYFPNYGTCVSTLRNDYGL